MERLREEVAKSYFDQMSEALTNPDPAQLEHMRQAFDALNRMIEQREAGEEIDPSFESFMEQFGDLFPGNPKDLDELLEQLAAQMAAAQAMSNSMSPEQRAQLQGLAESLLEDMDLRWQVDRLAENLQQAVPGRRVGEPLPVPGRRPDGHGRGDRRRRPAARAGRARGVPALGQLAGRAGRGRPRQGGRSSLGEDAAQSLDRLAKLAKQLEEAGLIDQREGRFELTAEGHPPDRPAGAVRPVRPADQGPGGQPRHHLDRAPATTARRRPSPTSSATRSTSTSRGPSTTPCAGPAAACRCASHPDDFEVIETEALTRSATVLLLDLSLSMPMRDNFVPAKKMAMALHTLISSQFPRDYLGLVGFSEVAREIEPEDLPDGQLGLRLRDQPAARADPGPQDAGPPAGDQADHPGHRRRADRPHRPLRRRARLRRRLQLPADARDARADAGRGDALHQGAASPSTPSCSTPTGACGASSTS